ncbi:hypothetical protein, partial [Burkholderia sp. ABCPW 14]|uniref:hypothetical protein n=1 Tax=Burkholderia sp. ABCPW 14 TaxID=1637860 RepID=UPI001E4AC2F6
PPDSRGGGKPASGYALRRLAAPANMRTFHLLQNRTFLFVRDSIGGASAAHRRRGERMRGEKRVDRGRSSPACTMRAASATAVAPGAPKPRRAGRRRGVFRAVDGTVSSIGSRRSIIRNVSGSYKVGAAVSRVRAKSLF